MYNIAAANQAKNDVEVDEDKGDDIEIELPPKRPSAHDTEDNWGDVSDDEFAIDFLPLAIDFNRMSRFNIVSGTCRNVRCTELRPNCAGFAYRQFDYAITTEPIPH